MAAETIKSKPVANGTSKPSAKITDQVARMSVTDQLEVMILVTFLVQKHGAILANELPAELNKLGASIHAAKLRSAVQGLKKRQIIAINQQAGTDGHVVDRYEIRLAQSLPTSLEVAHIKDLLPELLRSKGAEDLKKVLESEDAKGEAKGRENTIRQYRFANVIIQFLDPIYGSQIPNPESDRIRKKFGIKNFTDNDKIFERTEDGCIVMRPDALRGWFATNVTRLADRGDTAASYFSITPAIFNFEQKVGQTVLPVVNSQRGGRAGVSPPVSYETIAAGAFVSFRIGWPIIGTFSSDQLEKMLHIAGANPRRGMSPARGGRTGRFRVVSFEQLGDVSSLPLTPSLDLVSSDLLEKMPTEMRQAFAKPRNPTDLTLEHLKYVFEATKRLANVALLDKKAGVSELEDDGDDSSDLCCDTPPRSHPRTGEEGCNSPCQGP